MSARPAAAMILVAAVLAACSATGSNEPPLPSPTTVRPSVVPGRPPLVWVSGQVAAITTARVVLVERPGARLVLDRLAEGATRFFRLSGGRYRPMLPAEVAVIDVGTPACAEALFDHGRYLTLRIFVGSACGPRG